MITGVLVMDLFLPESQPSKSKRSIIRPLMEGIRGKWNTSVAETGFQDSWQRARICVATVSGRETMVRETLDAVLRHARERSDLHVTESSLETY